MSTGRRVVSGDQPVKGEAYTCPFCGAPYRELIPAGVVQVKCRYCGGLVLVPPRLGGLVRRCPGHPETLAVGLCNDCSGSYCDRCLFILLGLMLIGVPDPVATGLGGFNILCSLSLMAYGFYAWTTPWKKPTVHMRISKIEAEKGGLPPTAQKLYSKMLNTYTKAFGYPAGKRKLEKRIEAYMEKGLERKEAILKVAQDEGYVE